MKVAIRCDPANPGEVLACYGLLATLDQDTPPHMPAPLGHFRIEEEDAHFVIETPLEAFPDTTPPGSFPAWLNSRRPVEVVPKHQAKGDKIMPIQVTDVRKRRIVLDWWLKPGITPLPQANAAREEETQQEVSQERKDPKKWDDKDCSAWKSWGGNGNSKSLLTTLVSRLKDCEAFTDTNVTLLFNVSPPAGVVADDKGSGDFGFDARSQWGAYNLGFSLTDIDPLRVCPIAYFPWTTWFAILGLQAWHPTMSPGQWRYRCWTQPLPAALARWPLQDIDRLGWASGPRFQPRVHVNGNYRQLGFSQRIPISSKEDF